MLLPAPALDRGSIDLTDDLVEQMAAT